MDITLSVVIASSIANIWLATLIFIHGKARQTKRYFILMSLGIVAWIISNYLSNFVKEYQYALLWNKLIFVTTSLAAWSFLIFSNIFPKGYIIPQKKFFCISFSLMIITIGISLSPYLVKEIIIKEKISEINFGWGVYFYTVFLLGCLLMALIILIVKYFKTKESLIKKTIRLLVSGMGSFLILSIGTNLMLPIFFKKFELTNLAPFYTVIFLLIILASILRYEFLETKVILTEILIGLIGLLLIVQIFTAPTVLWRIGNGVILVLFCIGGWLLIRYTFREIKRRKEAEKLSQAKSEFLSIVSHQLRTPLTAIKGYLSMILEESYGSLSEKLKKVIENIYTSNERLIKLVNDFLNATRIETGKMELELERVDLEELIKNQIKELEIKAKEKGIYLNFEKPKEKIPQVLVDKEKIGQVILNLIDNAIKYTHSGGITVSLEKLKDSVRIKIKDTGEGMIKKEIEKLFESFSRGTAGMKFYTEGAGLGLYISKKLIELHKGKIWAESEGIGKGSTFYVELPIK